jgi:hypothetical protein
MSVTKSEGAAGNFPASAYAYTPGGPSTWKLRLRATPSGGYDSGIVGAAVAALGKGFRGQKVQIPSADLAAVKAKVKAAWKSLHPGETVPSAIASADDNIRRAARK